MKRLIWTSLVVVAFALPAIADTMSSTPKSKMGTDASTGSAAGMGTRPSSSLDDAQMQQGKSKTHSSSSSMSSGSTMESPKSSQMGTGSGTMDTSSGSGTTTDDEEEELEE